MINDKVWNKFITEYSNTLGDWSFETARTIDDLDLSFQDLLDLQKKTTLLVSSKVKNVDMENFIALFKSHILEDLSYAIKYQIERRQADRTLEVEHKLLENSLKLTKAKEKLKFETDKKIVDSIKSKLSKTELKVLGL